MSSKAKNRRQTLEPLFRLRKFEYEMNQTQLKKIKEKEYELQQKYQQALNHYRQACTSHAQGGIVGQMTILDEFRKKIRGDMDLIARQCDAVKKSFQEQLNKTLEAKTKLEMINRLLEKVRMEWMMENEIEERKILDDLSQRMNLINAEEIV